MDMALAQAERERGGPLSATTHIDADVLWVLLVLAEKLLLPCVWYVFRAYIVYWWVPRAVYALVRRFWPQPQPAAPPPAAAEGA